MTPSQWQHHINAWQGSHQSKNAYCKDHGLSYSRFLYWSNRRAKSQPAEETCDVKLLPVTVTDHKPVPAAPCLGIVEFPNGTKLHIHSDQLLSSLPTLVCS